MSDAIPRPEDEGDAKDSPFGSFSEFERGAEGEGYEKDNYCADGESRCGVLEFCDKRGEGGHMRRFLSEAFKFLYGPLMFCAGMWVAAWFVERELGKLVAAGMRIIP
jgi:hypothetical protein